MTRVQFRSQSLVTTALLLLSAIVPASALAQRAGSSVSGSVDVVLGDDLVRTIAFSAETLGDGAAAGRIEFQSFDQMPDQDVDGTGDPQLAESKSGVTAVAEVNCVAIVGDMAVVGGQVVKAEPARYVGKQMLLLVEDSDRAKGRFTFGFYESSEGVFCDSFRLAAYQPIERLVGAVRVLP
jgi:hypothetical protein